MPQSLKLFKKSPFFQPPEQHKSDNRHERQAENDDKRKRVILKRNRHVHGKSADHKRRHHDADGDDVERFHQHVQVIADDGGTGIHEAGQNVGINLRLLVTLRIFNDEIVEQLFLFLREADLAGVILQLLQQNGIAVDGVEVLDQALFQR